LTNAGSSWEKKCNNPFSFIHTLFLKKLGWEKSELGWKEI
jgi:hypothetical protein